MEPSHRCSRKCHRLHRCCINEAVTGTIRYTVDKKAVGRRFLELESDVMCSDGPPLRRVEDGGRSVNWRTYVEAQCSPGLEVLRRRFRNHR